MDYKKAVSNRKSIRSFTEKEISVEERASLKVKMEKCLRLIPEIHTEFIMADGAACGYLEGCAGYEGLTFKAPAYLVLLSETAPGYLENAGYMNEDMILAMTDLGLDSCWLTVDEEESLRRLLNVGTEMRVAAVTAFGHGKKEKSLTRLHIKSPSNVVVVEREGHVAPKMAISELVYEGTWKNAANLDETAIDDGLREAFFAASCAPTFLNRQPFRLLMGNAKILLVKILDPLTGEIDARLNCGAVMLNFAAVLEEHRPYAPEWVLGKPEEEYELPVDCEIVGYCVI